MIEEAFVGVMGSVPKKKSVRFAFGIILSPAIFMEPRTAYYRYENIYAWKVGFLRFCSHLAAKMRFSTAGIRYVGTNDPSGDVRILVKERH